MYIYILNYVGVYLYDISISQNHKTMAKVLSIPCQAEGVRSPTAFSSECLPMEGRRCVGAPKF